MIIWLASYPKSGNTLARSLLSSYIFSKDGNFNFELLKNIKQFPDNSLFKQIGVDTNNEEEMYKNYINSQKVFYDDVLREPNESNWVPTPIGYRGANRKTISKYTEIMVKPKNHRFASYAILLKSFP